MEKDNTILLRKYMPINLITLENLANGIISFSSPEMFNDPYEVILKDAMINKLEQKNNKQATDIIEYIRNIKIGCFETLSSNRENSNSLLWSYYGDSHKGIALDINYTPKQISRENYLKKEMSSIIKYSQIPYSNLEGYIMDETLDEATIIETTFFHKHILFRSENEYRIMLSNDDSNFFPYNISKIIKSMTIGLNVSDNRNKLIQTLHKENYSNVPLYKMIKNNYQIKREKIK